ncbi:hypothetical protein CCP3SC5AM1_220023 [Gammaproteobacteria bacterium]
MLQRNFASVSNFIDKRTHYDNSLLQTLYVFIIYMFRYILIYYKLLNRTSLA